MKLKFTFIAILAMLSSFAVNAANSQQVDVVLPTGVSESTFGANTVTDGTNYYATLQAATEAVVGNADAVLYCKPSADVGSLQHAPVTATLTVYGNGASVTGGSERDFDFGNTDPSGGKDITADMTLTVKNLNGCGAWGTKATEHTVNLVFEGCGNMGKVLAYGTTGVLNITLTDCAFEGVLPEAVYSNADGAITLNNVAFSNLNKAINLNHKAAGTQTVTISGCSFTNCGNDVNADQIPVRVLTSVEGGKSVLNVSNTTFTGTPEGGADILLDYGVGVTEATVTGTAANVLPENKENNAEMVSVTANEGYSNVAPTDVKVATLAELQAALAAENELPIIITETIVIPQGETVVLDLNGKTVTRLDETNKYAINNLGTLTIQDTKGNGSINARGIYNGYGDGAANVATAKITVVNGTINAKGTNGGGAAIFNYGVADIQGGTFTSVASYAIALQTGSTMTIGENAIITGGINSWQSTLTITGGTISNDKSGKHVVYAGESTVAINGGTFHNNNSGNATILASGSTAAVEITGGTFTLNIVDASSSYLIDATSSATYTISGGSFTGGIRAQGGTKYEITGGTFTNEYGNYNVYEGGDINISGGTFTGSYAQKFATDNLAEGYELGEDGKVTSSIAYVATIGEQGYATLEAAFAAATEGQTITLLGDATPALTSQRAITKAAVIDLGGKTMTLTEDDLYFGTTTFKNGTIVVDPSVKASTAVFWMFANQTLTFDAVKVVATGVTGTYLIGLDGNNSDLNLLNGSEILVENTTALDLDIICVNASTGNDIKVENSKVNVTNLDGRVFFRGNYTVKDSEVNLAGITKAGFRIEAGQTLSIEGTSKVNIAGEPRDGGIHLTDLSATYTKEETATVNATVNAPAPAYVAKIGEQGYATLAAAVAAAQAGETIELIADAEVVADETVTLDGVNLSTLNGVTLTNNGTVEVKGEVSLNIETLTGEEINFLDGAIVKNSTIGGSVFVAGNVTFRGANTFAMLYDYGTLTDYYGTTAPMKWTVEEGASVTLTNAARYGLGYGDDVTVYGNIENALTARENLTDADRSLFMHGLVAQESKGWNCDSKFTVENAYVAIGSNNSFGNKSGNYGGTYTFNIKNSVVDASRITFYEALSTTTFTFDGCDVKMGTFMTRDADSKFTLKNSKVLSTTASNGTDEGNYNKGELTLENSTLTYSAEFKHETGTINLDLNSSITAPKMSGVGTININAEGVAADVLVIKANMTGFTGAINVEGGKYEITDEGLVVKPLALEGEGTEASPYLISSVDDLVLFRNSVNAGETKYNAEGVYVALGANIDLTGIDWSVNIGDDCNATFDGIFDGKNYTISNLTATETAQKGDVYICTGLFGAIYGNAVVKNLTLENVTINAPFVGNNVSAVVGFAYACKGSIENVKVVGVNINAPKATGVGAIVGYDYYSPALKVENCIVDGANITAAAYAGGLVGYASSKIAMNNNTVEDVTVSATASVGAVAGIMLGGGSATDNTVKNVTLTANGALWANSSAAVAGTITGGAVTVSNTTVENVTANGAAARLVGGILVEKPTTEIAKVQAQIGDKFYTTLQAAATAAKENETVTLIADVEATEALNVNCALDLNGHSLMATVAPTALPEGYAALPNLDGKFVIGAEPTATVNNLGMTTVAAGEYSIWDGSFDSNTEDDGDMPLSFVMQFLADQDAEDMATSPFADWYGDFVLTFTGLENGSFTADNCYLAGHYGSFGWVKIPVDGMVIEDGARYPVMLGVGMGQKYDYICSSVEDFKCALYLAPEILEANPNIQVKLELGVVDNSKGSDAAASALMNNDNVYSVTEYTYDALDFDPNYIAEYVIDDANPVDFKNDSEKTVGTLTYKRNLIEGVWNALYLPFEIDVEELVENYDIAYYNQMHSYDSDNNGSFDSYEMEVAYITSGRLRANYPYFIRPKSAEACALEYVANDVTLYPAVEKQIVTSSVANIFTLSGTHKAMGKSELTGCYAISVDGDWSGTEALKAHRLYLKIEENDNSPFAPTAAKSIRIVVRGEGDGTTGVEEVETENEEVKVIYDLTGRRVQETVKGGIYIINGKKTIVK